MREFPMMDRMTRRDDYWSEHRAGGASSPPEGLFANYHYDNQFHAEMFSGADTPREHYL